MPRRYQLRHQLTGDSAEGHRKAPCPPAKNTVSHPGTGPKIRRDRASWGEVPAARCFDELLDLLYETGNYGLEYVVGYVLGYSEGLCGRTFFPPAKGQVSCSSARLISVQQDA